MNKDEARQQALFDRQNAIMKRNATQAAHWVLKHPFCFFGLLMAFLELLYFGVFFFLGFI